MESAVTTWHNIIGPLKEKEYFKNALSYVANQRAKNIQVFPKDSDIFNAFKYTPFEKLKIVILGQDPYHEPNQAMGLAFSVPPGVHTPPSLLNIYKELKEDVPGFSIPNHGCLIPWAKQGVLLLNTVLSVDESKANSHHNIGWEQFTDDVIEAINNYCNNIVFILWGNAAKNKGEKIDRQKHLVLHSAHPSPLSAYRGFFGCKHFSSANNYLHAHGKTTVNWQLPLYVDSIDSLL